MGYSATRAQYWSLVITLGLASPAMATGSRDDNSSCPPVPQATVKPATSARSVAELPIKATAKTAEMAAAGRLSLDGDVRIQQGNRQLSADSATVDRQKGQINAKGAVNYDDGKLRVDSQGLAASTRDDSAQLQQVQYQLLGSHVRGSARSLHLSKSEGFVLKDGSFTTCPEQTPVWQFDASEINVHSDDGWGEAWGAKFKLYDVPVFYFPYVSFPVTGKRKSGLLYPTFGSSGKRGLEYAQPIYWNIAPNLDLTFTPRYMSSRGLQLNSQFRYLYGDDKGQFNVEYLDHDRAYAGSDNTRYLLNWQHVGRFGDQWRYQAHYTSVSDDAYFVDMGSRFGSATDTQITRSGELNYLSDTWDFSAQVKDFDVLGAYPDPYQALPLLTLSRQPISLWHALYFSFYSEFASFYNQDPSKPTAERLHLEPTLAFPLRAPAGDLTTEIKLYQTFYQQHLPNDAASSPYKASVSRTLPQLRLYGKLNFERNMTWDGSHYRQTLEPQFQYLLIPKKDQSDIALYDTSLLREDYHSLFRSRRYSGLDRITDANQLTLGFTTRFFDDQGIQRLRASLGETLYLKNADVGLTGDTGKVQRSTSALAGEMDWRPNRRWGLSTTMLYDIDERQLKRGNFTLNYRVSENKLIQLNHRYVRDISDNQNINQAGLRVAWRLDHKWQLFASHYEDLNLHRTAETFAGVEYEACCFAVRMTVRRRLNPILSDGPEFSGQSTYDNGFSLQIIFGGLGGTGTSGDKLLSNGLFSYREPYYLSY